LKGADERSDARADRIVDTARIGLGFEAEQMAQVVLAAYEPDELLGCYARPRDFERPRGGRPAQKGLDLAQRALRPGAPEYLAKRRKSGDFRDYDPVNRDRVGGED
jgi:hypothetical protein